MRIVQTLVTLAAAGMLAFSASAQPTGEKPLKHQDPTQEKAPGAQPPAGEKPNTPATTPAAPGDAKPATPAAPAAPAAAITIDKVQYVKMTTSMGDIVIELNETKAPVSTANFLAYVDAKFYDGTIFHRVIPSFMIQGGGFTADMQQKKTNATIKNEWQNGLKNVRGSVAMARLGGRADSATSQFFINVKDNAMLDQPNDGSGYAVFGKVVAGMDVVDKIKAVKTTTKPPHGDVPVEAVTITSVVRITPDQAKAPAAPAKTEAPKDAPKPADPAAPKH